MSSGLHFPPGWSGETGAAIKGHCSTYHPTSTPRPIHPPLPPNRTHFAISLAPAVCESSCHRLPIPGSSRPSFSTPIAVGSIFTDIRSLRLRDWDYGGFGGGHLHCFYVCGVEYRHCFSGSCVGGGFEGVFDLWTTSRARLLRVGWGWGLHSGMYCVEHCHCADDEYVGRGFEGVWVSFLGDFTGEVVGWWLGMASFRDVLCRALSLCG